MRKYSIGKNTLLLAMRWCDGEKKSFRYRSKLQCCCAIKMKTDDRYECETICFSKYKSSHYKKFHPEIFSNWILKLFLGFRKNVKKTNDFFLILKHSAVNKLKTIEKLIKKSFEPIVKLRKSSIGEEGIFWAVKKREMKKKNKRFVMIEPIELDIEKWESSRNPWELFFLFLSNENYYYLFLNENIDFVSFLRRI